MQNMQNIISLAKEDLVWEAGRAGLTGVRAKRVAIVGDVKSEEEFDKVKQNTTGTIFEYYKKIEGVRVLIGCTHDPVTE